MIKADASIIGKEACVLSLSIISDEIICRKARITAYMVDRAESGIRTKIRFQDGRWEDAKRVFYPEDEEAERKKFEEKYLNK